MSTIDRLVDSERLYRTLTNTSSPAAPPRYPQRWTTSTQHNDPLVVRADELANALRPFVQDQDRRREECVHQGSANRTGNNSLSGNGLLAELSGIDVRRVWSIMSCEYTYISLRIADQLLTAAGIEHALRDGTVQVIPSPRWSKKRYAAYMRAKGADPEAT